jgi:hypothetical protein
MNAAISQNQSSQSALSVFGNMPCAQCGASVIAPEWSECLNKRHIRHVWCCARCDYQFETSVYFRADSVAEGPLRS